MQLDEGERVGAAARAGSGGPWTDVPGKISAAVRGRRRGRGRRRAVVGAVVVVAGNGHGGRGSTVDGDACVAVPLFPGVVVMLCRRTADRVRRRRRRRCSHTRSGSPVRWRQPRADLPPRRRARGPPPRSRSCFLDWVSTSPRDSAVGTPSAVRRAFTNEKHNTEDRPTEPDDVFRSRRRRLADRHPNNASSNLTCQPKLDRHPLSNPATDS